MFLPCTVHVSRSTWYREVNMFRIFLILVSWINGQEEYCLSSAWILTSRYQSIVDNRVKIDACVLRAPLPALTVRFWGAPRGEHLSIRVRSHRDQLHGPIRFPQHLFSVHDHGRQRSGEGRSTLSTLTLAWLYIEPSPCWGVRPAGDPVDSDPGAVFEDDPHPRSDAGRPLEPWVCQHTREPTVLSRLSCRPPHLNFDRFHQLCLFPWAHF